MACKIEIENFALGIDKIITTWYNRPTESMEGKIQNEKPGPKIQIEIY